MTTLRMFHQGQVTVSQCGYDPLLDTVAVLVICVVAIETVVSALSVASNHNAVFLAVEVCREECSTMTCMPLTLENRAVAHTAEPNMDGRQNARLMDPPAGTAGRRIIGKAYAAWATIMTNLDSEKHSVMIRSNAQRRDNGLNRDDADHQHGNGIQKRIVPTLWHSHPPLMKHVGCLLQSTTCNRIYAQPRSRGAAGWPVYF